MSVLILGGLLFFSVSVGGGLAWLVSKIFHRSHERLALLCGGFLVGLLVLDIIPSAIGLHKSPGIILGVFIGFIFLLLIDSLFFSTSIHKSSVYFLTIALFIHTIPLSLTIGNLLGESTVALSLTTSTLLHHLPEGFALTSAFLSQGNKLGGLFLSFIGLSFCFSAFIWIGHHVIPSEKVQSVLLGVTIGLLAITSVKEFILHNMRVVPFRQFVAFIVSGYLLSLAFHVMF
ncbi:zinc transporter family protein [Psychrobacillus sp. NPDC096426]|uniref:zinc transporter family protein n=1 Tax=Psychrobacillus sp. NPDC096426 TaxID=3364491 RepID=UPI0037F783AD